MRRAALAALVIVASPLAGQSRWREQLDPTRLRVGSDSFALLVGDVARGWQRLSARRTGDGWLLADAVELTGMVRQQSALLFSEALVEQAVQQEGEMGAQPMRIRLIRAAGRFRGTARTPTGGAVERPIDVAVSEDAIDDNAVALLLPAVRWAEGLSLEVPVLSSGTGDVRVHRLAVTGRGPVTVPAGTFETWQVTVTDGDRAWLGAAVTTTAPYRVVRMGPPGGRMAAVLLP
jgi:hypothetical protein